jgi:hypothetical protein
VDSTKGAGGLGTEKSECAGLRKQFALPVDQNVEEISGRSDLSRFAASGANPNLNA